MKYTYQDITKLQNEAEVSFEIADKALKKSRGNFNKALYVAIKRKKRYEKRSETTKQVSEVFKNIFGYRFVVYKGAHTYINVRVWILILVGFFINGIFGSFAYLLVPPLILTFFFNVEYKLSNKIKKNDDDTFNVEPVKETTDKEGVLDINLSEEKIEDDDEGYAKVEIDK